MSKSTKTEKIAKAPKASKIAPEAATEAPVHTEAPAQTGEITEAPALPEAPAVDPAPVAETTESLPAPSTEGLPGPIEAEAAYGKERLGDLLKNREEFEAEVKSGLEPAVAEALWLLLTSGKNTGRDPFKGGSSIPHLARSTCKDPVSVVWEVAAAMPGAQRKEVVAACVARGVATSTAHTQYQAWRSAGKLAEARKAASN